MRYLRAPLILITAVSVVLLWIEWNNILRSPTPGTDFSIYYHAVEHFNEDPSSLYLPDQAAFDQFLYPPPSILIFRFFHLFPERTGYFLFIGVMYLCLVAALFIGQSLYEPERRPHRPGYIIFLLASAPVYHSIILGQIEGLVLLLSILYLYFSERKPLLAGVLLAAAIWIKVYPFLLLLPALFSKEGRKTVLACLMGIGLSMVFLLPFIPLPLYVDFIKKIAAVSQLTCANIINQSVVAFGQRGTIPIRQDFQWPNIYRIPIWLKGMNYMLLALMLALACFRVTKQRGRTPAEERSHSFLQGAVMLAIGTVFSPLGWGHIFVLNLPLWIAGIKKLEKTMRENIFRYGIVLIIALLLLIPVYTHPAFLDNWPFWVQQLFYSRFLFITLFFIAWLYRPDNSPLQTLSVEKVKR